MRVYLVGYMGAGKTTLARRLATLLGMQCADLDDIFEARYKIGIPDFFRKYDEQLFRRLESQLLKETAQSDNIIISTGGGTACFYDNMEWMNSNGITVYLKMEPSSIVHRLTHARKKRPLVESKSGEELLAFVREHLRHRNIFYSQAQIIVKGESVDAEALATQIAEYASGRENQI
ncbi:MAG: shikimate kinase [Bacteroidetes bacterium]|nr:shikimate kinase [Bacteroidota bacterium]